MEQQEIVKELQELKKEIRKTQIEFENISDKYLELIKLYEITKLKFIDPNIRDSAEKQMLRAMKENDEIKNLFIDTETFRRKRDICTKKLDYLKEQVKILTSFLYSIERENKWIKKYN